MSDKNSSIRKRIEIGILSILSNLSQKQFSNTFNLLNQLFRKYPITTSAETVIDQLELLRVTDQKSHLYICHPQRLRLYRNGITSRLDHLLAQYQLAEIDFAVDDLIVDCGANIGELTRGLQDRHNVSAICIEPDDREAAALQLNTDEDKTNNYQTLLWNKTESVPFYQANVTGDSSIFDGTKDAKMSQRPATTLDELLSKDILYQAKGRIKLLKLEAEGAEPEILEGADKILPTVEYITADCGPERGPAHENTVIAVWNQLEMHGFTPIIFDHTRTVIVFKNTCLVR